jgi:peptidoglycan/LPS O-acetylase OafA/YrhL
MAIVGIDRVQLAMPSGCADEARHPSTGARPVQSSDKPRRFVFVDALRGIAAMWVVVYHAFESKRLTNLEPLLPNWTAQLIHSAYLAVTIFFVLSGFVIAHSVARRRVDAPYVGWFMLRRAVRLDPPYWASILAIIVVSRHIARPGWPTVLAHMFYLQDLLQLKSISPIYWTLCLEFQLYLVFVVLLAIAHRFNSRSTDRRSLFVVFTAAALVASLFPVGLVHEATLPPGLFLGVWYTFLGGAFAYWALDGTIPRTAFYVWAGALVADAIYVHNVGVLVSMAIAALLLEVGRAGRLSDWLSYRPLQFLGRISYSLYLMHGLGGLIMAYAFYHLTPQTAPWELFWLLVVLAADCIGAWLFWRLVEAPCITLARYCRPPDRRVGPSPLSRVAL